MKLFYLLAILFSFKALAGFPPTSLKGQSQASAITTFGFQVPNNQATKTSTGSLIETGSQNLLSNPGFEHSTISTGWNVTNGTLSSTATTPFGVAAASFTGSLSSSNIQSLTGSGTAQAGLNCLVSAFVKTASSNVQLCAIHNGTLDTNLCVNVNSNNAWAQYQIPIVCDATSTVARVRITTSVSTTFDVDNVYVGVNPNITATTLDTEWASYTPTLTGFGTATNINFYWKRQGSDIIIRGRFTEGTTTATEARLSLPTGLTAASTITTLEIAGNAVTNTADTPAYYILREPSVTYVTFGRQVSATYNGLAKRLGTQMDSGSATYSIEARIPIQEYRATVPVISSSNLDYDWTAYTPTFTGFGTATGVSCYQKRQGSDNLIRCSWTAGTTTATEARVSLPSGLTSSANIATLEAVGNMYYGYDFGNSPEVYIEPSKTYVVFGALSATTTGLTKRNGNTFTSSRAMSFTARVPIQGWNNNNVIVGTFAGVGNIKGLNNSVNEVMFGFGTTTQYTRCTASPCTIFENGSAFNISVTRSTTGLYQIVFPSDFSPTVKPKCWLTGKESSVSRAGYCGYQPTNPTSTTINLECRDGTGNINDVYMDVFCKGY